MAVYKEDSRRIKQALIFVRGDSAELEVEVTSKVVGDWATMRFTMFITVREQVSCRVSPEDGFGNGDEWAWGNEEDERSAWVMLA